MHDIIAQLCKALSDSNRVKIIEWLAQGETCGCTLIDKLPISQPTLSYHLNLLHDAGLTTVTKDGTWKKYKVDHQKIDQLITFLEQLKVIEGTCESHG
jgi:ArsR family transcriptional regulator